MPYGYICSHCGVKIRQIGGKWEHEWAPSACAKPEPLRKGKSRVAARKSTVPRTTKRRA